MIYPLAATSASIPQPSPRIGCQHCRHGGTVGSSERGQGDGSQPACDLAGRWRHLADGGYVALAMVAEIHPIHHPPQSTRTVCRMSLLSKAAAAGRMMAQAMTQPMLYAV